jgi:transposase-like protein
MESLEPVILKRDALGRMKYSAAQRTALVDEFERGGLSGAAFARIVGVHYQTFASWVQKRRHARDDYQMRAANIAPPVSSASSSHPPVRLLEAVAEENPHPGVLGAADSAPSSLCVELRCGTRLLIGDAGQAVLAARLIHALNSTLPC